MPLDAATGQAHLDIRSLSRQLDWTTPRAAMCVNRGGSQSGKGRVRRSTNAQLFALDARTGARSGEVTRSGAQTGSIPAAGAPTDCESGRHHRQCGGDMNGGGTPAYITRTYEIEAAQIRGDALLGKGVRGDFSAGRPPQTPPLPGYDAQDQSHSSSAIAVPKPPLFGASPRWPEPPACREGNGRRPYRSA